MSGLYGAALRGLELVLPADMFGGDLGWLEKYYPAEMVAASMADKIMLIKWNGAAAFNKEEQRYQCLALRECPEGKGVRNAVTYLTAEDIAMGINPELMILLDIRVDQIKVVVEDKKSGQIKIIIKSMSCLECGSHFDSFIGHHYLCQHCSGINNGFTCTLSTSSISAYLFPLFLDARSQILLTCEFRAPPLERGWDTPHRRIKCNFKSQYQKRACHTGS